MRRYFIDTCVLIWLIEGHKRTKKIAHDMEYYQGSFAVSVDVLQEFANLFSAGKIEINFDEAKLIEKLKTLDVDICCFEKKHLKYLFELPYFTVHTDPIDRNIIAHAIADKRILISGDKRFSLYEKHGLKFLEI